MFDVVYHKVATAGLSQLGTTDDQTCDVMHMIGLVVWCGIWGHTHNGDLVASPLSGHPTTAWLHTIGSALQDMTTL